MANKQRPHQPCLKLIPFHNYLFKDAQPLCLRSRLSLFSPHTSDQRQRFLKKSWKYFPFKCKYWSDPFREGKNVQSDVTFLIRFNDQFMASNGGMVNQRHLHESGGNHHSKEWRTSKQTGCSELLQNHFSSPPFLIFPFLF